MAKQSGGLLVFRRQAENVEIFLVHPGGPIWGKRDVWSIPKGELDKDENHRQAATREFREEVGVEPPAGEQIDLGSAQQSDGKVNYIFAVEGDIDASKFFCDSIATMEWPPKSGMIQEFAENDKAAWFDIAVARQKVFPKQAIFFDRLAEKLSIKLAETAQPEQQSLL